MSGDEARWVARLTSMPSAGIDALVDANLGLDVWERCADAIVVAASEAKLLDIERRRLAKVERLSTVEEYLARMQRAAGCPASDGGEHDTNSEDHLERS